MNLLRRWARGVAAAGGAVGGFVLGDALVVRSHATGRGAVLMVLTTLEGLIFMYLATPYILGGWRQAARRLRAAPLADLLAALAGITAGLGLAALASIFIRELPAGLFASVILAVILAYVGGAVGVQRRAELVSLVTGRAGQQGRVQAILLDTSVIIDGRILDVCRSGFVDHPLRVPRSVLKELQTLADSADPTRRARGRRGLELLGTLRQERRSQLEIYDDSAATEQGTDARLVEVGRATGWALMTLDYNLNRVAQVEGVRVLNLNDLAAALRPVAIPGDELSVTLVKEGREPGQAVGYLDDGTMVVVENGRRKLQSRVEAVVTSVLQTASGRMLFAQLRNEADRRTAGTR